MVQVELTSEEKDLLRGYNRHSPLVLVRLKAQAVLMRSRRMKFTDIAEVVGRSERSVGTWLHDWEIQRMASLFTGHTENENAGKLTREQKEEIENVLSKPPSDQTIPKSFWDVPSLKRYVEATFGVVYESVQSYHFLLRFSNLSFKYPDAFDRRRLWSYERLRPGETRCGHSHRPSVREMRGRDPSFESEGRQCHRLHL